MVKNWKLVGGFIVNDKAIITIQHVELKDILQVCVETEQVEWLIYNESANQLIEYVLRCYNLNE